MSDKPTRSGRGADASILVFGQLAIGSAALMARLGLDAGLGPWTMAAWRLALASALLLAALNLWRRQAGPDSPRRHGGHGDSRRFGDSATALPLHTRLLLCGAGVCLGLHFATWFVSLQHIGVGLSTLLVSTSPVWAGLAEVFFLRKPPRSAFWIGLTVALLGLAFVTYESRTTARGSVVVGCTTATLGAAFLAAYMLMTRDSQTRWGTWRTVAWTYSAAAASLIVLALCVEPTRPLLPSGRTAWLVVVGMALVPQLVGHTTMNYALQRFSAGVVGVATLLEPVFAATLAWPAFGEPITLGQAAGAGVLLAGVGIVLWRAESNPN